MDLDTSEVVPPGRYELRVSFEGRTLRSRGTVPLSATLETGAIYLVESNMDLSLHWGPSIDRVGDNWPYLARQHRNDCVRAAAVREITDQALLKLIAETDGSELVRAALARLFRSKVPE